MKPIIKARKRDDIKFINRFTSDKIKILDVGCGDGYIMNKINGKIYGIDPEAEPCKNIIQGIAEEMPFDDNFFDIVYSLATLHHIKDKEKALVEIKRVMKKGGTFLIIDNIKSNFENIMRMLTYPFRLPFLIGKSKEIKIQTEEIESFDYHIHNNFIQFLNIISKHFLIIKLYKKRNISTYFESIVSNQFISKIILYIDKMISFAPIVEVRIIVKKE